MAKEDNDQNQNLKKITLKELYQNQLLFTKVKALFEKNVSYDIILGFIAKSGYKISKGTLTNLRHKINEAELTGVPLDQIIDKRSKTNINQVKNVKGFVPKNNKAAEDEKRLPAKDQPEVNIQIVDPEQPTTTYWSNKQVLDKIVAKGVKALDQAQLVDVPVMMKAIELLGKYYDKNTHGLTIDAIKQYEIILEAQLTAMKEVIIKYVPDDQVDAAYQEIKDVCDAQLHDIEATNTGKSLLTALREAGLKGI